MRQLVGRVVLLGLILAVVLGVLVLRRKPTAGCTEVSENVCLYLERAETNEALVRGLSGREDLPEKHALLFVYNQDAQHGIWMKDMRFSIDIVWLDADKRVVHQERSVSPATYPTVFRPSQPSRYVLELDANTSPWQVGDQLAF